MKTALVLLLSAAALAGCANPYTYQPEQAGLRAPQPYYVPPTYDPLPPVIFQRNLPPELTTPQPAPEDAVQPETQPPAAAADTPPPAPIEVPAAPVALVPAPQIATPAAVQAPAAPDKGSDVPMMGFRPMRGQKAPGA